MEMIKQKFYNKYAQTQLETVRNFINSIDWENRFIGIKGSRGVGKTTMILQYIKQSDFIVESKYTFEIGGKNKKQKQIEGIENSYVVKDNIEIGSDNIIPLWLFGFLY